MIWQRLPAPAPTPEQVAISPAGCSCSSEASAEYFSCSTVRLFATFEQTDEDTRGWTTAACALALDALAGVFSALLCKTRVAVLLAPPPSTCSIVQQYFSNTLCCEISFIPTGVETQPLAMLLTGCVVPHPETLYANFLLLVCVLPGSGLPSECTFFS